MPLKKMKQLSACAKGLVGAALFSVFVLAPSVLQAAALSPADQTQFEQANQSYRDGKFKEAAAGFEALKAKYPGEAAFPYNLGNSLFRTGEIGPALLAYERALRLSPRDKDIRANLEHVRGLLEYRIEDKRNWYVRAGESVLGHFRDEEVFFLVLMIYLAFLVTAFFCLAFRRGEPWGWWRKTLLGLLLAGLGLAALKHFDSDIMKDAIVIAKEAEVHYGPSVGDQVAFRLGEGLKVYVVDTRRDWSRIALVNHEGGWVKNSDIAQV